MGATTPQLATVRTRMFEPEDYVDGFFFFSSRRRHTRSDRDWSSDVCSSDLSYLSKTRERNSFGLCGGEPENVSGESGSLPSRLHEIRASQGHLSRVLRYRGSHGAQGTPHTTGNGGDRPEGGHAKTRCERQEPGAGPARSG